MKKIILVVLISISFAGCAKNPYPINIDNSNNFAGTGFLVVSVKLDASFDLFTPTRQTSYFFRTLDGRIDFVAVSNTDTNKHYGVSNSVVDFFNIPAGDYEIYTWSSLCSGGLSQWTETPKQDFSIPFRVEENKITYLGELIHKRDRRIYVSDMKQRDIEMAIKKYPFLSNMDILTPFSQYYTENRDVNVNISVDTKYLK